MSLARHVFALLTTVIGAIPVVSFAQTERGTISGLVTDETKAAVPGVTIKVINAGTNVATDVMSSDAGTFIAVNLPPGTYRIEATLQGFRTSIISGITLNAGSTARVDVSLNLGSMTELVNVVAENSTLQTEDAKGATSVSNRLIDELPLVVGGAMRSPFDLISTVPEAKTGGGVGNTAVSWSMTSSRGSAPPAPWRC